MKSELVILRKSDIWGDRTEPRPNGKVSNALVPPVKAEGGRGAALEGGEGGACEASLIG